MAELAFRQYKTPVMKRIGGFLLFAMGVVFLAFTTYYAAKDIPLWVFGKQTKAEVVEIWLEQLNELEGRKDGVLDFSYNIKYQFTTTKGDLITKTTTTSGSEWSGMWEGQKIEIVYFPLYPELSRLDDSNWALFLSCTYIPLVAIGIIGLRLGWHMLKAP